MGDKQYKNNNYTDFFYKTFRNILLVSIPLVIISALILSLPRSSANGVDTLTLTLSSSCTMSSTVDIEHNGSLTSGTYIHGIGQTTVKTLCNDGNGYSVYAVGYSNNEEGNNKLINSERPEYSIDTGLNTSGLNSAWAMKLNNIPDDPSPTPPTIESDYNNVYGIVPPSWTKVAGRISGTTDMAEGSSFTTTYAVYASSSQYAGTYRGQVKYLLTHPSSDAKHFFMQDIAQLKDKILLNEGDSTQLIDQRDGKSYWVTRLADGNIWMTQNLDFDISANSTLDSETTDLNVIYNNGQYQEYNEGYTKSGDIIYWTPASTATTIDFQNTGPITGWQDSNTAPYSASKTDSIETGHTSLGNYYNWTAAIASNDSSSLITNTYENIANNPKNSICPKGWRLPTISSQSGTTSGSTNEFRRLNYLYNGDSATDNTGLVTSPLWFTPSGYISGNTLSSYNASGFYWSSTISYDKAYILYFSGRNNRVEPNYNEYGKYFGWSIRCLARTED